MKRHYKNLAFFVIIILGLLFCNLSPVFASVGNIDSTNKYAWSENAGWNNYRPDDAGGNVTDTYLEGYIWCENIGWVKLKGIAQDLTAYGVINDGSGNLSGYAYSENAGWINFHPTHSQVTVDVVTGEFDGYGWSENLGWIHFKNASPAYNVQTSWTVSGDSDSDGMPDAWENLYGLNPNDPADALLDNDSDGLNNLGEYTNGTVPTDSDSDDDLMLDGWEVDNGLDPLLDDSDDDADTDLWTNLEEYTLGYDPNNACPNQPVGLEPADADTDISLAPTFSASDYTDTETDPHIFTQWQIFNGIDLADTELIFDATTALYKQTIQVQPGVLEPETTYYWRVRYSDLGGWSHWSDALEFETESLGDFLADNDGIQDMTGTGIITSDTGIVVQAFKQSFIDFSPGLPSGYYFYNDIFSFRIEGITPGATVLVTFQLDELFQPGYNWLKYYPSVGWQTYAVASGIGTTRVTLEFIDGGIGDIDGVANGVIVDPSGPVIGNGGETDEEDNKDHCFIATAAYGTPMAEEVRVLSVFRDKYLLTNTVGKVFVNTYYKVSPSIASFIREHPVLKNIVRTTLNPIIRMSEEITE